MQDRTSTDIPAIDAINPMGTDGIEFIEYAHPEPERLADLFTRLGFSPVARHRSKNVTLWRQGEINFVVNAEPGSFAARFAVAGTPPPSIIIGPPGVCGRGVTLTRRP